MFGRTSALASSHDYVEPLCRKRFEVRKYIHIRKAIGFLIILWGISQFFGTAFQAAEDAARESFRTIEAAAIVSQMLLENL
jgi:hypothetical protein